MKLCLICVEIFAWGKYGGFGRSTRMIGRELTKRGFEVTAVVPRRQDQKAVEYLDGIKVLGFERANPFSAIGLYRQADADIYHSEEPSFGTYLAQQAMPDRKHIITFRDTRTAKDWWIEFLYPSKSKLQVLLNILYEDNFFVGESVRRADRLFAASHILIPKARKKYQLSKEISFLPSPIPIKDSVEKSSTPVVCFLGRLDQRKRPQIFFQLASQFPHVNFIVIGKGQNTGWEHKIRHRYEGLPNLETVGFVDQFDPDSDLSEILGRSWILVNSSAREGLPTSFIEAAGHRCAILSAIDPDGFASNFGYHVQDGDFAKGLAYLLEANRWKQKGKVAYEHVSNIFSVKNAINEHVKVYQESLRK